MTNVSTRIKQLRLEHNLKQRDVAGYLDIPQQTYSYYEKAKRELPARHVVRLAKLYGVSTDFILGTHPRRAGTFDPCATFVGNTSLKKILLEMGRLNKPNRQAFIRYLFYLNKQQISRCANPPYAKS